VLHNFRPKSRRPSVGFWIWPFLISFLSLNSFFSFPWCEYGCKLQSRYILQFHTRMNSCLLKKKERKKETYREIYSKQNFYHPNLVQRSVLTTFLYGVSSPWLFWQVKLVFTSIYHTSELCFSRALIGQLRSD